MMRFGTYEFRDTFREHCQGVNFTQNMTTEKPRRHSSCVKALGLTRVGAART